MLPEDVIDPRCTLSPASTHDYYRGRSKAWALFFVSFFIFNCLLFFAYAEGIRIQLNYTAQFNRTNVPHTVPSVLLIKPEPLNGKCEPLVKSRSGATSFDMV